jgi:hypothetical protein
VFQFRSRFINQLWCHIRWLFYVWRGKDSQ